MAKVHPNAAVVPPEPAAGRAAAVVVEEEKEQQPTVLTVWRKSLLFNCDGFTVFDAAGDLAFRVDCYGSSGRRRRHAEDVVLMDAAGKPLLTVRRKTKLSMMAEQWVVYDGDASGPAAAAKPLLSVRRHHAGGLRRRASNNKKAVAHVTPLASSGSESYVVEGSYGRRSCAVRDARGNAVAEVRRKESVGDDVFRLVVADPRGLGAPLAMGIVIALDEMFGGGGSSTGASPRSLLPRSWSA